MNIILFDELPANYYPLSYTRPISYFRVGILTLKEKWEIHYNSVSVLTSDHLTTKFPIKILKDNLWINSKIIPSEELMIELKNLRKGELLEKNKKTIAFRNNLFDINKLNHIESNASFKSIENLWDIFRLNGDEIKNDFDRMFTPKKSKWQGDLEVLEQIKKSNVKIGNNPIYIEEGVKVNQSILNTTEGPIYIGKDAEIMEGSIVRGPFAMCNNSVLKMGSKIYEATTLGPYCKVGGEVNNSVLFGYSSKAHEGFLGNSVIGEWCNLGADTNTSNLKNNYEEVKLWNYHLDSFQPTGQQFCGLIMGDHSKSGINTMFNTGTVVGVNANIFGSGFLRNFVPSFSWGGASGFTEYNLSKAYDVAEKVFQRRGLKFGKIEKDILSEIYSMTKRYRQVL